MIFSHLFTSTALTTISNQTIAVSAFVSFGLLRSTAIVSKIIMIMKVRNVSLSFDIEPALVQQQQPPTVLLQVYFYYYLSMSWFYAVEHLPVSSQRLQRFYHLLHYRYHSFITFLTNRCSDEPYTVIDDFIAAIK